MKYYGRLLSALAFSLFVGAISSAASADTISVTIQKWTSSWGSLTSSSAMSVYIDGNNGITSVDTDGTSGFLYQTGPASFAHASDPFGGAVTIDLLLGLDSASTTESTLSSDLGASKTNSTSYWMKVFVEYSSFTNPGSSGTTLSSTTQYTQNFNTGTTTGSKMLATISDSGGSATFATATFPFSDFSDTKSLTRSASTYDVKQEWDIALIGSKGAQVDGGIDTHTVPEPVTILSTLIGLVPLGLMVRSFRSRKSED